MSERPSWMAPADEPILELLERDGPDPVRAVAEGLVPPQERVKARVQELAYHGLVTVEAGGLCSITDRGRSWLAGEIDASEFGEREP